MIKPTRTTRLIGIILAFSLTSAPLFAQRKRDVTRKPATPPAQVAEPNPTFDTLIAAGSYKVYFEIRGVGQLMHSQAVNDVIDPALKIMGGGKEAKAILKWLQGHADSLATSRLFVAAWPSRKYLPQAMAAIEFSSEDEAQKFEPELRRFIPTLMDSTPTPSPLPGEPVNANATSPSLNIMKAGSLFVLSEKPIPLQLLRPRKAILLTEDPNFVIARNRFASESLFLYVDVSAIEKEEQAQQQRWQEEERRRQEEEANKPKPEPSPEETTADRFEVEALPPQITAAPNQQATLGTTPSTTSTSVQDSSSHDSQALNALSSALYGALFGGQTKWPEAIAASANFEDEAYVVRALVLNGAESKTLPIPFLPHFISGPGLAPQSPNVLPGDADLFFAASLDYPQIYDGLIKTIALNEERARDGSVQIVNTAASSPFAEYEKKLGIKIKDDILPLLGPEMALAFVPKVVERPDPSQPATSQPKSAQPDPDPIAAIAVKDKEAVRRLIPKLIEAYGIKGAAALEQTERKDDTEIVSYANFFSYAFIGDFLVFSPNADVTKRTVDAYLAGETLAGNSHFRNARRWQSRELLAQIYVSPGLVQKYGFGIRPNNNAFAELARLATVEPLTYSLSNDGSGPLHELHVPKSLLTLLLTSALNDANARSVNVNEASAQSALRTLVSAEETFKATRGDGHYGTLDQLVTEGLISNEMLQKYGYRIELIVSADKFEATAVPLEYDKTGKLSFFVDESAVVRAGDHGGGAATISDPPIQ